MYFTRFCNRALIDCISFKNSMYRKIALIFVFESESKKMISSNVIIIFKNEPKEMTTWEKYFQ